MVVTLMFSRPSDWPSSARSDGALGPTLASPSESRITRLTQFLEWNLRTSLAPRLTPANRAVLPPALIERTVSINASLLLSFVLGFYLEATIGLIGFWFLEVSSLLFVYMLFNFFLSGHMFPLDMLPAPWRELVDVLPLKYLAYFPASVFLGKVDGPELVRGLWIEAGWVVFFMVLSRGMFARGVRRYSGYGG